MTKRYTDWFKACVADWVAHGSPVDNNEGMTPSPSKNGERRRCESCNWETDYIVKKTDGECPVCHGVVKYIPLPESQDG